ncbi:MAG: PHP domain-containing protein [Clostridiales bacterium]|nr:PHP domain-containing protein [Clostridiales bacterium]
MNKIDLHTHTTASDGTLTPSELIEKAYRIGLETIAVTDHDTTEGLSEALKKAEEYPSLEVIAGTELSSVYKNREVHIAGLFIDKDNVEFKSGLEELREKRIKRNIAMINKLKNIGLDVTYEELISVSGGKVVTRAHFAKLLQEKGCVRDKNEAFSRYIGAGKPGYIKRKVLSAEDSIRLIKKGGGLAVIAHPFMYGFKGRELEDMAADFAFWGADGIECYYPTHSQSDRILALSLAETYGLLPSGGSDFHGENKPGLELGSGYGDLEIPYKISEDLKVRKYGK